VRSVTTQARLLRKSDLLLRGSYFELTRKCSELPLRDRAAPYDGAGVVWGRRAHWTGVVRVAGLLRAS
jgi:hypothetical protein